MVLMKFNKDFKDKETGKLVEANKPVEVTLKRADEIVKSITNQAKKETRFKDWQDFSYERVEEEPEEEVVEEEEVAEEGE